MLTTSLKDIRAAGPCEDGWAKLLAHLGKTPTEAKHDTTPLPIAKVLDANGLDDALWVLDECGPLMVRRLLAADCAERVLPLFEAKFPDDKRPREAIRVARDPNATMEELRVAVRAAWFAAGVAWDAAGYAARAAGYAAYAAYGPAARAAAYAAAYAAARAAAYAAAYAAYAAADAAARAAERDWQKRRLRQYLEHGEQAAQMPWPGVE